MKEQVTWTWQLSPTRARRMETLPESRERGDRVLSLAVDLEPNSRHSCILSDLYLCMTHGAEQIEKPFEEVASWNLFPSSQPNPTLPTYTEHLSFPSKRLKPSAWKTDHEGRSKWSLPSSPGSLLPRRSLITEHTFNAVTYSCRPFSQLPLSHQKPLTSLYRAHLSGNTMVTKNPVSW